MRKILVAIAATSLLLVVVVASAFGSTGGRTSPAPEVSPKASAAPPRLGYYAGVECARWSCDHYYSHAKEGFRAYCGSKLGVHGFPRGSYSWDYQGYNYVCFKLNAPNQLIDFHFADYKIVRSVHVSTDRFPQTCDNGWCIEGEWFSTRDVQGRIRNPNHAYADYKAEWIGS